MTIQSVQRAVQLLVQVARDSTDGTALELARAAGLAAPTAHHLLSTLVEEGILAKDAGNRYVLGPTTGMLATVFHDQMVPPDYLYGPLKKLAAVTGDTSYLAAWRNGEIRILASILGNATVHVSVPAGPYEAAHARATGKVLLAYASTSVREGYLRERPLVAMTPNTITDPARLQESLETTRADGYAVEIEEFHTGVACVSAPILLNDALLGAYSLSAPVARFAQRRDELVAAVLTVASTASEQHRRTQDSAATEPAGTDRTATA